MVGGKTVILKCRHKHLNSSSQPAGVFTYQFFIAYNRNLKGQDSNYQLCPLQGAAKDRWSVLQTAESQSLLPPAHPRDFSVHV